MPLMALSLPPSLSALPSIVPQVPCLPQIQIFLVGSLSAPHKLQIPSRTTTFQTPTTTTPLFTAVVPLQVTSVAAVSLLQPQTLVV